MLRLHRFLISAKGAAAIEYALVTALIAAAAIVTMQASTMG